VGMYLELAAVSDGTIERLHADPPLVWQIVRPDEPERVATARAESRSRPGLLARLLRRGAAPPPEPEPPPLELGPGEGSLGALGDMEKTWHGVHYLLTGTAWEGEAPLNFLLAGGKEVDIEVGQAPVLTHTSAETRAIATALAALSDAELRARYDPAEMMRLEIYPEVWDRAPEEGLGNLINSIASLRDLLDIVVGRGYGLMVTIT
jgi:Domain of unknown function (DUF1877)